MKNEVTNLIECGITWQGEGPDSGRRMLLLRFKKCNRNCPYCDTQVRMRSSQEFTMPLSDIQNYIDTENVGIMITGGEPLYNLNYVNAMKIVNNIDCMLYNIETNGLRLEEALENFNPKPDNKIKFILSPKLFSDEDLDFYIDLVNKIYSDPRVYIKLVYQDTGYNEAFLDNIVNKVNKYRIYLMPEGKTREELLKNSSLVFDKAEQYKVNFSSRDHLIYNFI